MKKLHFENTQEFETVFKSKDIRITDSIVSSIENAIKNKRRSAELFLISFEDVELLYEITLPFSQWEIALESSLKHYTELGESDKAIDTFLVQKKLKSIKAK